MRALAGGSQRGRNPGAVGPKRISGVAPNEQATFKAADVHRESDEPDLPPPLKAPVNMTRSVEAARRPASGPQASVSFAKLWRSVFLPMLLPKLTVSFMSSVSGSTERTVPTPNVRCLTRAPGAMLMTDWSSSSYA